MKIRENEKIRSKKSSEEFLGQRVVTVTTNQRIVKIYIYFENYLQIEFEEYLLDLRCIVPIFKYVVSSSIDMNAFKIT